MEFFVNKEYAVFVILGIGLILFIWGKWRHDIVALMLLLASVSIGAISPEQAFLGFANPAVITVAAVMILSIGIADSNLVEYAVDRITKASSNASIQITILTVFAAVLSAFINNIGALSLLIPVILKIAKKANRSPSIILMPVAFASILGGLTTLIGTPPNIIISSFRAEATGEPYSMFSFAPLGLSVAVVGVIYIILLGRHLIPKDRSGKKDKADLFQVDDYITEAIITKHSPLVGKPISAIQQLIKAKVVTLGLIRNKHRMAKFAEETLEIDDVIILRASIKNLEKLQLKAKLLLTENKTTKTGKNTTESGVLEVVISPTSNLVGQSYHNLKLHMRHGINLLAMSRRGHFIRRSLKRESLRAGDVLLLEGDDDVLTEIVSEYGFLPLADRNVKLGVPRPQYLPLIIFLGAIILIVANVMPVQVAFTLGVVAMLLFKVVSLRKLYSNIDGSIIVLLGAMIPVGNALQTTGGAALISGFMVTLSHHVSPIAILAVLLVITMNLTDLMNNAATAIIMAPIAIQTAEALHYSIDPFIMVVAIGASSAFLTPIGHQNNTLIMGVGGYRFGDYWRMGLPLQILILITTLLLVTHVWPLYG